MARFWILLALLLLAGGCREPVVRMERPENPNGPYREQIAAARRLLAQRENWADRAEWEIIKTGDGWRAIAWRVEHPEAKGADRYLPWGYSVIELDRRSIAVEYHRKG